MNYECNNLRITTSSDNNLYVVQKTGKANAVRMGERELMFLLEHLKISTEECGLTTNNEKLIVEFNQEDKDVLLERFQAMGFLDNGNEKMYKRKHFINIRSIKVFSINLDALFNKSNSFINVLLNRFTVAFSLLLFMISIILFSTIAPELGELTTKDLLVETNIIALGFMQVFTLFVHELYHGMSCKYYGGSVPEIGCMLYYFLPVMYCNTNDVYTFPLKRQKVFVALAGVYANLVMSGIGMLIFTILWKNDIAVITLLVYSALNIGVSIFNLIPFVKYDGYWVLSALLNMTNMIDKSFTLFISLLLSNKAYNKVNFKIVKKIALTLFGFISSIFDILFWLYTFNGITNLFYPIIKEVVYVVLIALAVIVIHSVLKRWKSEIYEIINDKDRVLKIKFF